MCHASGSEKDEIKDCEFKRNIFIINLKRNQIIEHKLREELEKYGEVKSMRVRQDKHRSKYNIGMACLATEEQAKPARNMLIKTKHYVANKYKHRKKTYYLNNNTQEKDKRCKNPDEENTTKNIVISPDFLVWKFCLKAQFPNSFRQFAQNYGEIVPFRKISTSGD